MNEDTGIRTIKEVMLYEGSAVLWAANPETPTLNVKSLTKEDLPGKLEKMLKAFRHGTFTDETFSLMEIEIMQIQKALKDTQPVQTVEPYSGVVDALKSINNLFN